MSGFGTDNTTYYYGTYHIHRPNLEGINDANIDNYRKILTYIDAWLTEANIANNANKSNYSTKSNTTNDVSSLGIILIRGNIITQFEDKNSYVKNLNNMTGTLDNYDPINDMTSVQQNIRSQNIIAKNNYIIAGNESTQRVIKQHLKLNNYLPITSNITYSDEDTETTEREPEIPKITRKCWVKEGIQNCTEHFPIGLRNFIDKIAGYTYEELLALDANAKAVAEKAVAEKAIVEESKSNSEEHKKQNRNKSPPRNGGKKSKRKSKCKSKRKQKNQDKQKKKKQSKQRKK
jgi:hypothetical protein